MQVEQILVTAGLTDLLGMLARTLLGKELNAVTSERSFIVYRIATEAANVELIEVPMRNDAFDLTRLAAAVNKNTRIIFLANPNNPTGTIVTPDEVDRLSSHTPQTVVVVLAEAYYRFPARFATRRVSHYSHALDSVREVRNVIVLG